MYQFFLLIKATKNDKITVKVAFQAAVFAEI
jgi:hypothetical protein